MASNLCAGAPKPGGWLASACASSGASTPELDSARCTKRFCRPDRTSRPPARRRLDGTSPGSRPHLATPAGTSPGPRESANDARPLRRPKPYSAGEPTHAGHDRGWRRALPYRCGELSSPQLRPRNTLPRRRWCWTHPSSACGSCAEANGPPPLRRCRERGARAGPHKRTPPRHHNAVHAAPIDLAVRPVASGDHVDCADPMACSDLLACGDLRRAHRLLRPRGLRRPDGLQRLPLWPLRRSHGPWRWHGFQRPHGLRRSHDLRRAHGDPNACDHPMACGNTGGPRRSHGRRRSMACGDPMADGGASADLGDPMACGGAHGFQRPHGLR